MITNNMQEYLKLLKAKICVSSATYPYIFKSWLQNVVGVLGKPVVDAKVGAIVKMNNCDVIGCHIGVNAHSPGTEVRVTGCRFKGVNKAFRVW